MCFHDVLQENLLSNLHDLTSLDDNTNIFNHCSKVHVYSVICILNYEGSSSECNDFFSSPARSA